MIAKARAFTLCLIFFCLLPYTGMREDAAHAFPPIQKLTLENGLTVLFAEDHSLPFLTLQLLLDAGSRRDPVGQEGLAFLTAHGLLLGTSAKSAAAINEELDFMGASLDTACERDFSILSLQTLKKQQEKAFDLFVNALTRPSFPEGELAEERDRILAAIRASEDDPGKVSEKAFMKTLFAGGPYGHEPEGTAESVKKLARDEADRFYRTYYRPDNAILAVAGDITVEEIKTLLIPRLMKWQGAKIPRESFKTSFAEGPKDIKIDRAVTQATVIIGNPGISRDNPDYYALAVMNEILGGGSLSSRLTKDVRVKHGLAYSVESFFDAKKYPGSFQVIVETKNGTAREAISLILAQMERIRKEPVTEAELEETKKHLTGNFPLRFDTQEKLAQLLVLMEYFGLGMDYPDKYPSLIRSVSAADVLRVARKYLHPESRILVILGNLKEAGMEPASP